MLNKLLAQQVQEYLGDTAKLPEAFANFIKLVSGSYNRYDGKIRSLENAVKNHADELAALNEKLLQETAGLKNAHQQLSRIFNQVNEGFFTRDVIAGRYIHMSVGCEKIYGYTIQEFFDDSQLWYQVIHPDDKIIIDRDNEILNKGVQIKTSYRIIHKDTSTRWIEVKAIPVVVNGIFVRVDGVVNDITGRKKAEILLKDSEMKYRSFFEHNMDGILLSKPNGPILEVNPAACEILRATAKEICGFSYAGLMEFAGPGLVNLLEERSRTGKFRGELDFVRSDGTKLIAEIASGIFKDGYGEDRSFIILRDITERKKAEKQLTDSERRYRTLFEQNLAGIYQTMAKGKIITCNHAFAAMLGYSSPQELLHTNAGDLYFTIADRDDFISDLREQKKLHNREIVLKCRDGNPLYLIENISLTNDLETGEEICEGILIDITERKKAEAMLKESEERYRQIVETAQEGIWVMDEHYLVIFVNKKMCELLEYSPAEMLGKPITFFMEEEGRILIELSMESRRRGISDNIDLPFITKSGKLIWTNLSASHILNEEEQFIGGLAMITDITKRKSDEERLKKSEANLDLKNKELNRKNTELEQFAYVASHDLQEPLRTTSSFVQLLLKQYHGKLDAKADKYLSFIVESVDRMKILINDLLDYSRIGNKREMERVDCNRILQDVTADLQMAIKDCGAEIIPEHLPVINGYPTEIKQLFQNLLINAIKFGKKNVPPQIKISVERTGGYWNFAFADNGIGIDKEHSERIFIIFQRLHTRSEYEGSGIGLSHCKKIVELHHGKIWVDSVPGEGSVFNFTIRDEGAM